MTHKKKDCLDRPRKVSSCNITNVVMSLKHFSKALIFNFWVNTTAQMLSFRLNFCVTVVPPQSSWRNRAEIRVTTTFQTCFDSKSFYSLLMSMCNVSKCSLFDINFNQFLCLNSDIKNDIADWSKIHKCWYCTR